MPVTLPAWLQRAADAIRLLADRPWTLFVLLLALNAIARPCSITAHDARLYSLQALNQAESGAYGEDVFLRYGSQDQFSLFSRIAGPLVATFGVRLAFFLLYITFNTLFIFAVFRLARALIDDPLISTLALIYLVTASLSYGGFDIFTVHEQFFTPRTIGSTFTLFALERLLRHRFVQALALLIAGASMHPLMAVGGVMIWTGYVAAFYLPRRVFVGVIIATIMGGAAILAIPAVGTRLFGAMDDDWHQLIRVAVGYNYPDTWQAKDWINLAMTFAVPIAAVCSLSTDPDRQRFLLIACLAGAVGFLVTLAASFLPYALLFQGQPYRVLWILKVLQIPFGFLLIARWSQATALWPKIAALVLVAYFCMVHYLAPEFIIIAGAVSISILLARLAEQTDWWWYGGARGLVLGAIGWMIYRCGFFYMQREVIVPHFDVNELVLLDLVSPIFCMLAVCALAAPSLNIGAVRWSAVAAACVIPLGLFALDASPDARYEHTRLGADIAFVRQATENRERRFLQVYSSLGRPDLLWIDVEATSYFDIIQTAGVMFNRKTAHEIQRRAEIVARFELAHQRRGMPLDDTRKLGMENMFKIPFDSPAPTQDDLVRLCNEPGLDYVVIPQEFPGLYSATNGRVFVYECYKVKSPLATRNSP